MQTVIGREETTDILDEGVWQEEAAGDADASWDQCEEDTSSLLSHAQYSPQSTPSSERPRSPECLDRSSERSYSSDCPKSGPGSDTHGHETGSDSDAPGRSRGRAAQAVTQRKEPETWDSKAFANCRPLECQSIWDIPTSRVPKPAPPPVRPVRAALAAKLGGARSLPKISISLADNAKSIGGSPVRKPETPRGRTAAVVCLSLSLVAAAVVGAMLFLQ